MKKGNIKNITGPKKADPPPAPKTDQKEQQQQEIIDRFKNNLEVLKQKINAGLIVDSKTLINQMLLQIKK